MLVRLQLCAAFFLLTVLSSPAQSPDSLTLRLTALHTQSQFPGFAVAIVSKDSVLYQHGFGMADLAARTSYTPQTIQSVGSVSKTLIGVSLMQCVERGLFTLDTPINSLLPFPVVNPYFPADTIRIRHLATHTSGLIDYEPTYKQTYVFNGERGTVPARLLAGYDMSGQNAGQSLHDFLSGYYTKTGRYYNRKNFLKSKPGQTYAYSNIGAALAAYLVEVKTGQSYADYTEQYILQPLGMSRSGWSTDSARLRQHARAYTATRLTYPDYTSITYPDGNLRTSCADLSRYLQAVLRAWSGTPGLLSTALTRQMLSPQFGTNNQPAGLPAREPNAGIFWSIRNNGTIGHTGSDPGATAFLFFNPQTGIGKIFMTNTDLDDSTPDLLRQFVAIWKALE